ncbi:Fusaric acid resistance protein conserved region [Chlorobaculum parvum NCIB 8327]|uniref:Fusaric acid resistance protein conserved region n=1 Tax=Chlorobaculum parvum (strain DSM 263 / NCIMB 8327) TaxID=517417 RepID=B3QQM6_CHLP8|nr:FUSC family protein [Chlorobaculum parvum]ACF12229.1 Fusaric acid resistance protein conserved region [Chlorobaculum parvum NCIB 8327]
MLNTVYRSLLRFWPEAWQVTRSVTAALAAYTIAVAMKLESPYWAAMTALIVLQPTGGQLLEKSFYRLAGTIAGALGGLMMLTFATSSFSLILMLCLWLAICVGVGNLIYGYRSYGFMVAGFTLALIVLEGWGHQEQIDALVVARIDCIFIGIVVTTAINISFTPRNGMKNLNRSIRNAVLASLKLVSLTLQSSEHAKAERGRHNLLFMLADIEKKLDSAGAGTLALKRRRFHIENLIVDLLSLLETSVLLEQQLNPNDEKSIMIRQTIAERLDAVTSRLEGSWRPVGTDKEFARLVAEVGAKLPVLASPLLSLSASLDLLLDQRKKSKLPNVPVTAPEPRLRERNWQEAARASLRAVIAVGITGTIWQLTGWREGPVMMMATAIMVSIFSTHDHPSVLLSHIFGGALVGVLLAFVVRLLLIPGQSSAFTQGLLTLPVLLGGMIAKNRRKTALGAMDTMMFFLFVMQPGLPVVASRIQFVAGGVAGLAGIVLALLSFRYVVPVNPALRLRTLLISIAKDLLLMTETNSPQILERGLNRTRYRVLRMLDNASLMNRDMSDVVDGSLAALAIGSFLKRMQEERAHTPLSEKRSLAMREFGAKLSSSGMNSEAIISLLKDSSFHFSRLDQIASN